MAPELAVVTLAEEVLEGSEDETKDEDEVTMNPLGEGDALVDKRDGLTPEDVELDPKGGGTAALASTS